MRKIALYAAVICLAAMCAAAQESGAQAGTSSSSSQTTTTTTTKHSTRRHRATKNTTGEASNEAANTKNTQLTGCLSGPNDEGVYVLKNGNYRRGVEVGGRDDLKDHVGHKVKLTGSWATGEAIGEKEKAGEKHEKEERGERHFKVDTLTHVADTCTLAGGARKGRGSKGAASSSTQK